MRSEGLLGVVRERIEVIEALGFVALRQLKELAALKKLTLGSVAIPREVVQEH